LAGEGNDKAVSRQLLSLFATVWLVIALAAPSMYRGLLLPTSGSRGRFEQFVQPAEY
jgi:hypothetical protein